MDWIDINDEMPKLDTKVKVKSKEHESIGLLSSDYYHSRPYLCVFTSLILEKDVTHWRELTKEELRFSNTRQK